jgi:hypothetical protein
MGVSLLDQLTERQRHVVTAGDTRLLVGPAGTGKTTALHHRLLHLLRQGEQAYTILALVAEDEDRAHFFQFLHERKAGPYADLTVTTYVRLAREMVNLFWPLVARQAGFQHPHQPPAFLGYDLAQLLLWRLLAPMLEAGAFADLRLRPQQIVSQVLDTLNRAALNQLTLEEAAARQRETWPGDAEHLRHLREAALAAAEFRRHCLEHSLLDLSLTVRVFDTQLVNHPEFHRYFSERFRHLLVDNVEEQTPAGQHFVATLMNATRTTTIAYDAGGGYKRFLSADPAGARRFRDLTGEILLFDTPFTTTEPLQHLSNLVENYLIGGQRRPVARAEEAILAVASGRYRRDMVNRLIPVLAHLIEVEGVAPEEIAVVAPYLDGALRYMLEQALREAQIPYRLLRRRSSPRDEPRIRAWLTWLALAHPEWETVPSVYDVGEALALSVDGLDPARAALLAGHLYDKEQGTLLPAGSLSEEIVARAGAGRVETTELLRRWLSGHGDLPLDAFLQQLWEELLAQPPFRETPDKAGAAVSDWLVRTATRLHQDARRMGLNDAAAEGRAFLQAINEGMVTADPPELGEPPDTRGIIVATMYAYLLAGETVRVQVWLEASGTGWWDVPRQPLSNAFVLAQSWPPEQQWTMEADFRMRNELLSRLVRGLVARCRQGIVLASSELDRRGQRQEGPLWRALQPALRSPAAEEDELA